MTCHLCNGEGDILAAQRDHWRREAAAFKDAMTIVYGERDRLREALTYLVERCEREWHEQDHPPELDFVVMAVAEVREKVPALGEKER